MVHLRARAITHTVVARSIRAARGSQVFDFGLPGEAIVREAGHSDRRKSREDERRRPRAFRAHGRDPQLAGESGAGSTSSSISDTVRFRWLV